MKKKKIINIYIFLIGLIFVISGIVPSIIDNIEIQKIKSEISLVSNCLKKKNITELKMSEIDKKITLKNNKLEYEIEKYLKKIITITSNITSINDDLSYQNILSINNLKDGNIEKSNDYLDKLKNNLTNLNVSLLNLENENITRKSILSGLNYDMLINQMNTDNYQKMIEVNLKKIDGYLKILNYLKDYNSYYEIESDKVVFLKRSYYEEFIDFTNNLKSNNLNMFLYDLKSDGKGPVINARDITLYEGTYYNLKNNISCIDEVDGDVDCSISGEYDKNIIGSYPIRISAIDSSGITSEKLINVNVIEKERLKYYTEIIRNYNTVIVYELDENNEYNKIARIFPCSTGRGGRTPTGIFYTNKGYSWGPLMGGVWGQYYTVINGNILFHSVPYYLMSKDTLEWEEYNKLGEEASAGCVRLSVADAKWIYDNCPNGMKVKIYDGDLPEGIEKPIALKIGENSPFRGWDPTDPDINNPWNNSN